MKVLENIFYVYLGIAIVICAAFIVVSSGYLFFSDVRFLDVLKPFTWDSYKVFVGVYVFAGVILGLISYDPNQK